MPRLPHLPSELRLIYSRRGRSDDECWPWDGAISQWGYGRASVKGRHIAAHRFAYEALVGPIPAGMCLDHTCHNHSDCPGGRQCMHRRCVNPAHLEPTSLGENVLRGKGRTARLARQTHCKRGHRLEGENLRIKNGTRQCRTCLRAANRAEKRKLALDPEYKKRRCAEEKARRIRRAESSTVALMRDW